MQCMQILANLENNAEIAEGEKMSRSMHSRNRVNKEKERKKEKTEGFNIPSFQRGRGRSACTADSTQISSLATVSMHLQLLLPNSPPMIARGQCYHATRSSDYRLRFGRFVERALNISRAMRLSEALETRHGSVARFIANFVPRFKWFSRSSRILRGLIDFQWLIFLKNLLRGSFD